MPGLTSRQRAIALLVAKGLPDKLIACELGISEETVNFHLKKAFLKFGYHSRVQLALRVMLPAAIAL